MKNLAVRRIEIVFSQKKPEENSLFKHYSMCKEWNNTNKNGDEEEHKDWETWEKITAREKKKVKGIVEAYLCRASCQIAVYLQVHAVCCKVWLLWGWDKWASHICFLNLFIAFWCCLGSRLCCCYIQESCCLRRSSWLPRVAIAPRCSASQLSLC